MKKTTSQPRHRSPRINPNTLLQLLWLAQRELVRQQLLDDLPEELQDQILDVGELWLLSAPWYVAAKLRRLAPVARRLVARLRPITRRPALPPSQRQ
jgi:hypothetical protein